MRWPVKMATRSGNSLKGMFMSESVDDQFWTVSEWVADRRSALWRKEKVKTMRRSTLLALSVARTSHSCFFSQILFLFLHFHGFIVHLLLLWLSNNIADSNQHFLLYARYCSNQFYMYSLINHSQQIYEIQILQEEAKDWWPYSRLCCY